MHHLRLCLITCISFLSASSTTSAQSLSMIHGVVRAPAGGAALSEVNVYLGESGRGSATDRDGYFRIQNIEPGTYVLAASRVGYRTYRQVVELQAGEERFLEIVIVPQPIELDEMLAQSDRPYSTASSRTVREFDLVVRPTGSTQDLLQLAPGLITAQHAGGGKAEQIFLRGFDTDHGTDVYVAVDGVPVNMVSHGHGQGYADLHFVIPDVVRSVDIHKGPYAAAFGNFATAGAVTFTTRDHLDHNLIRVEGGSFETGSLTALYQVPLGTTHQGAYLAGQFYRTDGPFDSPQGFQRSNLFGKFHTHLSESSRLAISVSGFASAWDASGQIPARAVNSGLIGRFGGIDNLEGGTTSRHDLNLRYEANRENHRFLLQGYGSLYAFKLFSNFTFFLEDDLLGDMIEQTDGRQLVGLNGQYQFSSPFGSGVATTTLAGCLRSDNAALGLWRSPDRIRLQPMIDSQIRERNLCIWIQEDFVPSPFIRFQLGARGDYFTFDVDDALELVPDLTLPHASGYVHQTIVSPKASLVISPAPFADLFLNVGTGLHSNDARSVIIGQRVEHLYDRYEREGRNDAEIDALLRAQNFDPEQRGEDVLPRAIGYEAGIRAQLGRRLNVGAAAWRLDLEREYVYVGDEGFTELSGQSRRYGVDLEVRLGLLSWLSADADLNLAHGRFTNEPEGEDAIPLAPRRTSSGGVTVLHPNGLEGSVRYVHIGDRPANEDGSITADGYTLLNAYAAYRFRAIRAHVSMQNLLDIAWNEAQFATLSRMRGEAAPVEELHFTPGNPRNLTLGLAYLF